MDARCALRSCSLRGRWLQCAGFHAGVPVKVRVSHERLVVELDRARASRDEVLTRIAQVTEGGSPSGTCTRSS